MTVHDEARALGDPTRYRLFQHVAAAPGPVTVAELTDVAGLGHNAVRQHLAKLVAAGLLEERSEERHVAGRPRLLYSLAPGAAGRWDTDGPYRDLSLLLLEVLSTGGSPVDVGRRAAAEELAARSGVGVGAPTDGVAALVEEMARRGFAPRVVDLGDDQLEVVLDACPFADAAATAPGVVCGLHDGLAKGVVDAVGDVEVVGLAVRDPRHAGCRLRLQRRHQPG